MFAAYTANIFTEVKASMYDFFFLEIKVLFLYFFIAHLSVVLNIIWSTFIRRMEKSLGNKSERQKHHDIRTPLV